MPGNKQFILYKCLAAQHSSQNVQALCWTWVFQFCFVRANAVDISSKISETTLMAGLSSVSMRKSRRPRTVVARNDGSAKGRLEVLVAGCLIGVI